MLRARTDEVSPRTALSAGGPLDTSGLPRTLGELLSMVASRAPSRGITYLGPDGNVTKRQTYPELLAEASALLGGLRRAGVRSGDRLFLQLDDNEAILPTFWACMLGGIQPLVAPLAPTYDQENHVLARLREALNLLGAPRVVTRAALVHATRKLGSGEPLVLESLSTSPFAIFHEGLSDQIAFFTLSSGSGGKTKCASLTHRALLAAQHGANLHCGHREDDVIFNWLPFDHIGAMTDWHLRPMLLGCDLHYAAKETVVSSPTRWLDILSRYQITHSWAPNFAYASLLRALGETRTQRWDLSLVRFLLNIGEPISARVISEMKRVLGGHGLDPKALRAAWGMTELCGGTVYSEPGASRVHAVRRESGAAQLVDLGAPIPGAIVRVVDESGRLVTEGTIGRVQVGGPTCFAGYEGDPHATAEAFDDAGWFHTGDLGLIAEGNLVLTGREKSILIVNGVKYYGADLESAVERVEGTQPSSTAVLAARSPGTSDERLVVFFVPRERAMAPRVAEDTRALLARELGVTPDDIIALGHDELPRTQIGKIGRGELARRYESGMYEGRSLKAEAATDTGDRPLGTIELALARLWRDVLGHEALSPDSDFFKLGGSSLLATRLLGRIRESFRVKLAMSALFHSPRLRQMAEEIVKHEERPGLTLKIAELLLEIEGMRARGRGNA